MGKIIYNKGFKDLIIKQTVAPTINFIEKDASSITVTFTNNSSAEATISYGLSSPPNDDTVLLTAGATSNNVVISGLQDNTAFTIFASANGTPENLIESSIVSIQVTTDLNPFSVFFDSSGSPGANFPINDLDGNIMADLDKDIAYYGTVSHTDLFNANELASELGITQGDTTQRVINDVWFKYYWNGGIHFWRSPIRNTVTFNTLLNAGAVYGTGTTTPRKGTPSLTSVNQNAELTKNGITYIFRLPEGSVNQTLNIGGNQHALTRGSEFNLIWLNLHVATNSGEYFDSPTNGFTYKNWVDTRTYINDDFVGWKTNLSDGNFNIVGQGARSSLKYCQENSASSLAIIRTSARTGSTQYLSNVGDLSISSVGDTAGFYPVLTVKHPSFATYGKTGGFNQNEPDF